MTSIQKLVNRMGFNPLHTLGHPSGHSRNTRSGQLLLLSFQPLKRASNLEPKLLVFPRWEGPTGPREMETR